ncbi:MAG: tRNA pseudouridine(38-40) synthase TruA, partial [Treponemataceae bacterium]|nr:tRNA pseudouridine(38-40) synthase TruA [Treponemataceae bacterium]
MRNILLTISYDGTDFCGWQRQDSGCGGRPLPTVQGSVEAALERLHGQPVALHGSGRTDSGVHALAQAANFFSPVPSIPVKNYVRALNALLPPGVRIMNAEERPGQFDARFCATSRVYRYFLSAGGVLPAAMSRYVWSIRHAPDVGRLN